MPQDANNVIDHFELFRGPEYQEMLARKKEQFENPVDAAEVARVKEWAKTEEYQELNFAREALTVNPAKACQPLGAVFVAVGFESTIPFVHGSQGCVAYYRSHFSRHFKEPTSCVSSSMTEDAAVFGGLNNMIDGLAKAADIEHDLLALQTRLVAIDHRLHQRLVLGDDAFGAFLDLVVEIAGDLAQRFLDLGGAEEVVFNPRNTVLLFHVPRDVVHRAVAVEDVELGLEDEITRAALQFMLHDEIETHELASLEEAYAKGSDWLTPDVLLLGISIVKARGPEVVGEIVARYPDIRILIVTGKEDEAIAIDALKKGAHGALVKPLTLEAVRKKVDTILGRAGGAPLIQLGGL